MALSGWYSYKYNWTNQAQSYNTYILSETNCEYCPFET